MKKLYPAFILLFISGILFAQTTEKSSLTETTSINDLSAYPKEIAEIIFSNSRDFPDNTQLSVALIENGKINYYGILKSGDTIKSIENQHNYFEIGSITKVFTASVLASLIIDRKLKVTDTINAYYNFKFKNNIQLNFLGLANHTSGLPRLPENLDLSFATNPYKNYGKDEINEYLKNILKLENEPLKSFTYSNLGMGLLGYSLGLSQNSTYQELLQKRIFDKYEMKNSFTTTKNLNNQLVKGQDANGEITPNWDFNIFSGAGGIVSTTEDLALFALAQFNPENRELALTRKSTFTVSPNLDIGLGWHILKSKTSEPFFWHNGGTGGYSSSITVNTANKTAVVILSNVSAFHTKAHHIDEICFKLLGMLNN